MPGQAAGPPAAVRAPPGRAALAIGAICVAAMLVYGSLAAAPPLIWDDEPNIFANLQIREGSWLEPWTAPYFGMYIPLISTIWKALYQLGGGDVWPFRLFNMVVHAANIVLVAALLRGLFRRLQLRPEAGVLLGVAFFALHPLQTATVSWISGGRDLTSAAFAFAAVGVFLGGSRHRHVTSTILFAAGLLCKPHIAGIPLAVLAFVWSFERPRMRETAYTMGAWGVLAAASAVITSLSQAELITASVPLWQRPIVALDALGFHLLKSIAPWPLAADYGRTPAALWARPQLMLPTLALLAVVGVVLRGAVRRDRAFRVAFAWPLVLLPVLGLVPFAYQGISTVADHYNYVPIAVLGAVAAIAMARAAKAHRRVQWAAVGVVVLCGGALSWKRSRDWIGNERFFSDMLAKNPGSFSAQLNLSTTLCERGDWQKGVPLIRGAAATDSTSAPVLANLAFCLYVAREFDEVLGLQQRLLHPVVRENLERNRSAAGILANSLAGAFVSLDMQLPALAYLCQAQAVQPQDPAIAENVLTVIERLRERGERVRCPGMLPWEELPRIVAALR